MIVRKRRRTVEMIDSQDMRRRAPRLTTQLEGVLSGRTSKTVTIIDLSSTGCLVRCSACPEPGTILDLQMTMDEEPFAAKVRVAESSLDGATPPGEDPRYLTGLEFLALPAQEESRLLRFLETERRRRCAHAP
jgi:hypothetical protein